MQLKSIFNLFLILFCAVIAQADMTSFDENNFVNCYSNAGKSYLFSWDHYIKTPTKTVYYVDVKNCGQIQYLKDVPQEQLHSLSEIKDQLPEAVLFSIQQVENGAHVARIEKNAADYIKNRPKIFISDAPEVLSNLRYDVGDSFASEVINLWSQTSLIQNRSCDSFIGNCDFYLCQEQKNPCGLDGYNLSYGYKYCSGSKFKLADQMETEAGKTWVTEVFKCLQSRSFEASENLKNTNKCEQIKEAAFDSHPDCYVQAGFCNLAGREKTKIFSLIKGEIFSAQTIKQGLNLLKQCSKRAD